MISEFLGFGHKLMDQIAFATLGRGFDHDGWQWRAERLRDRVASRPGCGGGNVRWVGKAVVAIAVSEIPLTGCATFPMSRFLPPTEFGITISCSATATLITEAALHRRAR